MRGSEPRPDARSRHDGLERQFWEVLPNLFFYIAGEHRPVVDHGQGQSCDLKLRIRRSFTAAIVRHELRQPSTRSTRSGRDQDLVCCHQRVQRQ